MPSRASVEDKAGYASAAMAWDLPPATDTLEVTISMPYFQGHKSPGKNARAEALTHWRRTLGHVRWQVPPLRLQPSIVSAPPRDTFLSTAMARPS